MDVSNNINYTSFLTKLTVELPESTLKKPKVNKIFYPSKAHIQLLNICCFVDFLNMLGFVSLVEVNEFVTEVVNKRIEFEKEHK